jgi:hypothetical protein
MNNTPLTLKEANEIGGAMQQLVEHLAITPTTSNSEQKALVLTAFVKDKLLLHAGELLAAWFTMDQEYKPMIQAQATMMGHCLSILQRREQLQKAQQGPLSSGTPLQEEMRPDNVVQLVTP